MKLKMIAVGWGYSLRVKPALQVMEWLGLLIPMVQINQPYSGKSGFNPTCEVLLGEGKTQQTGRVHRWGL